MTTDAPPSDFTFAVPDDWVRIRVAEPDERESDVRTVARAVTRGRPDRDTLLPQLSRLLSDAATAYGDDHTVEVYLSLVQEGGLPVVCALAVGVVPPQLAPGPAEAVEAAFLHGAGPDGRAEVAELAGGAVPRVRRRVHTEFGTDQRVESDLSQYCFVVPGGGLVVLSFSTPQLGLLEPLHALFDAVAGSFRWLP